MHTKELSWIKSFYISSSIKWSIITRVNRDLRLEERSLFLPGNKYAIIHISNHMAP